MVKGFILAEDEKKTIEECDILFCVGVKSIEKNDINHQVEVQRLLMGGGIGCGDFIAVFGEATLFLESFRRSFKTVTRQQKDKREE